MLAMSIFTSIFFSKYPKAALASKQLRPGWDALKVKISITSLQQLFLPLLSPGDFKKDTYAGKARAAGKV